MTRLGRALQFLRAFIEESEERSNISTLVKTGKVFLNNCERHEKTSARREKQTPLTREQKLKALLLSAMKSNQWELSAEICREIANSRPKAVPQQRVRAALNQQT